MTGFFKDGFVRMGCWLVLVDVDCLVMRSLLGYRSSCKDGFQLVFIDVDGHVMMGILVCGWSCKDGLQAE